MGLVFAAAGVLSAATLNVELTVSHGIESPMGAQDAKSRRVAYFVIDRSGSMTDATLEGGRTPNDALLESLKMRLDALPDGTSVCVIPFASVIKAIRSYNALDRDSRGQIIDFVKQDKPGGCTLLYDAQDLALTEAARTMQRDPGAEVSVYVYTDGRQETPWDYKGDYPACTILRKKDGLRYKSEYNPNYDQENKKAFDNFKKKFADFVQRPNLEIEYEWLSRSKPPDTSTWAHQPRIGTELSLQAADMKNPQTEPEQTVTCNLSIPISIDHWKEIAAKDMMLDLEVDGKHSTTWVALDEKKRGYKVNWPTSPSGKPVTARLSLSHLPGGKRFQLKDPKPLALHVPAR